MIKQQEALKNILEIAYAGHPDGRETRLRMIERTARAALDQSCAYCHHYDGDGFCSLPKAASLINGYIPKPELLVCAMWVARDEEGYGHGV